MKILFICQYFHPEVFRGNDIAFHWAEQGHDVHVVTGIPNYNDGKFHKGYGLFERRREEIVHLMPNLLGKKVKVHTVSNYYNQVFDIPETWRKHPLPEFV